MTMPAVSEPTTFEPTEVQEERARALRRFNRLFVYLPMSIVGLGVFVVVGLLLWGSFSPNITGTRAFTSALADIILILTIAPVMLLCALFAAGLIGLLVYGSKKPEGSKYGRVQTALWKLHNLSDRLQANRQLWADTAARPIIQGRAKLTYYQTLLKLFGKLFSRS